MKETNNNNKPFFTKFKHGDEEMIAFDWAAYRERFGPGPATFEQTERAFQTFTEEEREVVAQMAKTLFFDYSDLCD